MRIIIVCLILITTISNALLAQIKPLKIGVAGLSHTHVHWIFNSNSREEIEIIGIAEANDELALRYTNQYKFNPDYVYNSLEELIDARKPDAVAAFGTIYDHLRIVEICAPLGIHVMVEKPLAVNLEHARQMAKLAKKHNIHLLTNYETTWYPSNHKAFDIIRQDTVIGDLRKIVVRDGHKGPKKIGVDKEFLEWLTDPVLNGGGAITDFGCYGANLVSWILNGERPNTVTAVTKQQQAENNPKVDDEAIIILDYDKLIAIIQASWNWPIGRKDMEIYGLKGALYSDNRNDLRIRIARGYDEFNEEHLRLEERKTPYDDPFVFLAAVINGKIKINKYDPSSLENNLLVTEILDAAIRSARSNQSINLKK